MANQLTGRIRYRSETKWGRKILVLQVEENAESDDYAGGYVHTFRYTHWRDATVEDLPVQEPHA